MSFDWSEQNHINFAANSTRPPALDRALALSYFNEAAKKGAPLNQTAAEMPPVLYPQIHVLSGNKPTRNKTRYPDEAHKGSRAQKTGQHSFTRPYPIPLIGDHRATPECGTAASEIYGRMIDAKLVKNTESGASHVAGLAEVPHPDAIFEILTGLWLTGSLGSSVHHAQCSVCGMAFTSPGAMQDHEHQRGAFYRPEAPPKPEKSRPSPQMPQDSSVSEDQMYVQCDPKDRGAVECLTDIMSYSAREYSRVVVPSDDESVIDVVDTSASASHFTTAPAAEASEQPSSALWVPMSASSRANISAWGERYIDLISGQERAASELGLMSGTQLHEHFERLLSDEDADVALETVSITRQAHIPRTFSGLTVESEEPSTFTNPAESTVPNIVATEHVLIADKAIRAKTTLEPMARKSTKLQEGTPELHIPDRAHYEAALRGLNHYKGPGSKAKLRASILTIGRKNGWS